MAQIFVDIYTRSYTDVLVEPLIKEALIKLNPEIAEEPSRADEVIYIPSTAGIGTNLYLAKIALDITAKHAKDHMGFLTEELYRETLWDHQPITDFWQIASGKERRLAKYGIHTMRQIAQTPEDFLYRLFGIDAELLIDHAWGRESCLISDIKSYKTKSKSVSFSQILPRDYNLNEARIVATEMIKSGCQELMRRKVIAGKVWIGVGYSRDAHPSTHGTVKLESASHLISRVQPQALTLFDRIALADYKIRRIGICFSDLCDEGCEGYDLFTDWQAVEREKNMEHAVLHIMDRYGKNALLRGTNYLDGSTQRERNGMIGGHRAGYDDPSTKS